MNYYKTFIVVIHLKEIYKLDECYLVGFKIGIKKKLLLLIYYIAKQLWQGWMIDRSRFKDIDTDMNNVQASSRER